MDVGETSVNRGSRSRPSVGGVRIGALICATGLLTIGCASIEHRYLATQLPAELQASAWRAPCTVDLSQTVAGLCPPKFDFGDEVEVVLATGLHSADITRIKTTVADDGTVELPVLGRISIAGTTSEGARQAVFQACHRDGIPQSPVVQISLQRARQHQITVTGAVQHPGIYTLPRQCSDLVSALAAAGGVCRDAGPKITIQSRSGANASGRPAAGSPPIDCPFGQVEPALMTQRTIPACTRRDIQLTSGSADDLGQEELRDGDVVVVERRDPPAVLVTGMVQKPGRYELPTGVEYRVLDAVASAQGVSHKVIDTVVVCRTFRGGIERALIQVSLRKATRNENENIVLMPGDLVSVETNAGMLFQDVTKYVGLAFVAAAGCFIHF
jgi:polysaccharide export outer membrane protein